MLQFRLQPMQQTRLREENSHTHTTNAQVIFHCFRKTLFVKSNVTIEIQWGTTLCFTEAGSNSASNSLYSNYNFDSFHK